MKAKTALENFNDDGHFLISFRRGGGGTSFTNRRLRRCGGLHDVTKS